MAGDIDLAAIMDALASRVRDSADFDAPGPGAIMENCYPYPVSTMNVPCFVVGYPPAIDLDLTAGRGSDRMDVPCWAVFGVADLKATRDVMSPFLKGLKGALDGAEPGVWQSARARSISLETVQVAEMEYLTARFDVDVVT